MKAPFPIQAMNNEFEVLAIFLGIADDNDAGRSLIEVLGKQEGISTFKYNGELYSVAPKQMLTESTTAHGFNSNWYGIQKKQTH